MGGKKGGLGENEGGGFWRGVVGYLVQQLSCLLGQRRVGEHAVIAVDAVARGVEELAGEVTWAR